MEEFAALIAIDWADRQHAICLLDESTGAREHSVVKHTPVALQEWALSLRTRFGGRKLAVCFGASTGATDLCPFRSRRLAAQAVSISLAKFETPFSDSLIAEGNAAHGQHFFDITEAQSEAKV
jgi:hypothetical protein